MTHRSIFRLLVPAFALAAALAPSAEAFDRAELAFKTSKAHARACHTRPLDGAGVQQQRHVSKDTGLISVRTDGTGDWDLAVFDAKSGRYLAGSASPDASELAQGFVAAGQEVIVQACRRDGAGTLRADVTTIALKTREAGERKPWSIVTVETPTSADKTRLLNLGFDEVHSGTDTTLDVLVHGDAERQQLRNAGFDFRVKVADVEKLDAANMVRNAQWADRKSTRLNSSHANIS